MFTEIYIQTRWTFWTCDENEFMCFSSLGCVVYSFNGELFKPKYLNIVTNTDLTALMDNRAR